MSTFKAMVVYEKGEKFERIIEEKNISDLPDNEVLIRVKYSSLNYKDALSATGHKGVTKNYPHTPGIDAAGIVENSKSDKFKKGDEVIVIGYDLGMNTPGGFGQYISVPANWVVKKPDNLTLKQAMIFGTAGFTAAMSVDKLIKYGTKKGGKILVTGATGGVGSIAVSILAKEGFYTVAATGKLSEENFLKTLGAQEVVNRDDIIDEKRPLLKETWDGVVDTVGGTILSSAIKALKYGCSATSCGLAQSPKLDLTVFPFILRGVNLLGIDSVECSIDFKEYIWNKIAKEWNIEFPEGFYEEVSLEGLNEKIDLILKGKIKGRILVNLEK
ncbi:acryloyl-CoA reductase [Deferribacter autotrophicus]|uniref:Acryloyl-CoA reductase n=1 Tax=Deferribacter autotrophicus TaxID=500465 RepID=A0A5A8F107_9BACT|nr:YhdH/YhfP family quinone oxidoreductase [Deferribacter autotrophicus]KAA0257339.1 acryloyl-CoA reductase [Deferribacter autotrophicus]